ncbi:hypothetical protein ACFJGW_08230 [Burkholderiaceae bacterium UC74_6]
MSPFSAPRRAALGAAALRVSEIDAAQKAFQRSLTLNEMNPVKPAAPLLKKADLPAAMDSMRRARELLPQNPRALLNLVFVLITRLEEGWDEPLAAEARDALETAEAVSPGNVR